MTRTLTEYSGGRNAVADQNGAPTVPVLVKINEQAER